MGQYKIKSWELLVGEINWSEGAAWMGGNVIPLAEAKMPVTDWGLTHSDITYDVVHLWDGRFFRLDDYLSRFEESLHKCRLSVPQSRDDIRSILHGIVAQSGLRHSYVSFVASRGRPAVTGSRDPHDCINYFYAWCVPFVWVFTEEVIERGAKIYIDTSIHRISKSSVDPTAKNYHWGDFTQALLSAKDAGFDNTILLNKNGHVTEGPGFNVFVVKDGAVSTPREGVLEGITRKVTMEICAAIGSDVTEKEIAMHELLEADEVFATTTGGGIIPVVQVNEHTFSNNAAGELTRELQRTYWEWHNDSNMSEAVCYD